MVRASIGSLDAKGNNLTQYYECKGIVNDHPV